jgi:hypothetical protein
MRGLLPFTSLVAAGLLAGVACGDNAPGENAPTPTPSAAATTANATGAPAATSSPAPSPSATPAATATTAAPKKVSANNATRAELQAAFEAAGIPGASQWAREVVEYRPYPENDPNMAKLRQELAKYNPAPGVVDQIIATLSLP